jgi:hypothetical protein
LRARAAVVEKASQPAARVSAGHSSIAETRAKLRLLEQEQEDAYELGECHRGTQLRVGAERAVAHFSGLPALPGQSAHPGAYATLQPGRAPSAASGSSRGCRRSKHTQRSGDAWGTRPQCSPRKRCGKAHDQCVPVNSAMIPLYSGVSLHLPFARKHAGHDCEAAFCHTLQTKSKVQDILDKTISRAQNNYHLAVRLGDMIGACTHTQYHSHTSMQSPRPMQSPPSSRP